MLDLGFNVLPYLLEVVISIVSEFLIASMIPELEGVGMVSHQANKDWFYPGRVPGHSKNN